MEELTEYSGTCLPPGLVDDPCPGLVFCSLL